MGTYNSYIPIRSWDCTTAQEHNEKLTNAAAGFSAKPYAYDPSPYAYHTRTPCPHTRMIRGECLTSSPCHPPYAYTPHHTCTSRDGFPHKTSSLSGIRVRPLAIRVSPGSPLHHGTGPAYSTRTTPWAVPHTRTGLYHTRMGSNQANSCSFHDSMRIFYTFQPILPILQQICNNGISPKRIHYLHSNSHPTFNN